MCGRYLLTTPAEALARLFGFIDRPNLRPRHNVAPTQTVLAVLVDPEMQRRAGAQLRWDLVPFWAKDVKIGYSLINAKAETVAEKPAFREAFKSRRCIIPADGFYEWRKLDAKGGYRGGNMERGTAQMSGDSDDFATRFCAILKSAVRDEMRQQLQRNPSADRRRILEMALRFQQEKLSKIADGWEASGDVDAADTLR